MAMVKCPKCNAFNPTVRTTCFKCNESLNFKNNQSLSDNTQSSSTYSIKSSSSDHKNEANSSSNKTEKKKIIDTSFSGNMRYLIGVISGAFLYFIYQIFMEPGSILYMWFWYDIWEKYLIKN